MNTKALNMILKLRQWEEELEKQKFISILSEKKKIETYINEIEKRFNQLSLSSNSLLSDELAFVYSEIQYLIEEIIKTNEILKKIDSEVELQREIYEEAFKEKKKIERLYDKIISTIKAYRERLEEKMISDIFISRLRSD